MKRITLVAIVAMIAMAATVNAEPVKVSVSDMDLMEWVGDSVRAEQEPIMSDMDRRFILSLTADRKWYSCFGFAFAGQATDLATTVCAVTTLDMEEHNSVMGQNMLMVAGIKAALLLADYYIDVPFVHTAVGVFGFGCAGINAHNMINRGN